MSSRSTYHSIIPQIRQAKEMAANESIMTSKLRAEGKLIGFSPRNVEQVFEDDLMPQDMSKIADKNQLTKRLEEMVSNIKHQITNLDNIELKGLVETGGLKQLATRYGIKLSPEDEYGIRERVLQYGANPFDMKNAIVNDFFNIAKRQVAEMSGVGSIYTNPETGEIMHSGTG